MSKRVQLTENIKDYMRTKCGTDVDFNQFAVYQARGISTEPISQNSLYDGGVLAREALVDMANIINEPLSTVSIQSMHDNRTLPQGKVFHAEVVDENNATSALYTLFGVSTEHPDLVNKTDNGVIDEVSYGFTPTKVLCSECGKDFMDPDVDIFDLWEGHCPECGAYMGKDGAHVNIPGVKSVSELSLVGRGAAKHAKILDSFYQMAMSEDSTVTLTKESLKKDILKLDLCSNITNEEVIDMTEEEIKAAILSATGPLSEEMGKMQATLASLGEEKNALEAAKDTAEQAVAALKEENASLSKEKADLESALEEAKNKAGEVQSKFDAEIQKVLVAAGLSDSVPTDLEAKLELLNKARLTLANIPVNGVSKPADKLNDDAEKVDFSAFKAN